MDENKINLLYDHYKECVSDQKNNCKSRDKLFLYLLILLGILFLEFYDATLTFNLAKDLLKDKTHFIINYQYFSIFLMFMLLTLGLRYFQMCITIERNYSYIHEVEKKINLLSSNLISKEGTSYLGNYPIFSNFMDTVYKLLFPGIFLIAISIRYYHEFLKYNLIDFKYLCYLGVPTLILVVAISIYIFSIWKQTWFYELFFNFFTEEV